jgi:hypothetical protein
VREGIGGERKMVSNALLRLGLGMSVYLDILQVTELSELLPFNCVFLLCKLM